MLTMDHPQTRRGTALLHLVRDFILYGVFPVSLCVVAQVGFSAESSPEADHCTLLTIEGKVDVSPKGSAQWSAGQVNQSLQPGDRVRTGLRSRATLRWSDLSAVRLN